MDDVTPIAQASKAIEKLKLKLEGLKLHMQEVTSQVEECATFIDKMSAEAATRPFEFETICFQPITFKTVQDIIKSNSEICGRKKWLLNRGYDLCETTRTLKLTLQSLTFYENSLSLFIQGERRNIAHLVSWFDSQHIPRASKISPCKILFPMIQ